MDKFEREVGLGIARIVTVGVSIGLILMFLYCFGVLH